MADLSNTEALIRMGVAMVIGALLGLERERADKPAGIRTYMLVSEGAALFMVCALMLSDSLRASGINSDPARIASTVVQGIGFLAGGVILTTGRRVRGMTTAASIWVAAALGLLVGAGFVTVALVGTVATVVALIALHQIEMILPFGRKSEADNHRDRAEGTGHDDEHEDR